MNRVSNQATSTCYLDFISSYCLFEYCLDKGFLEIENGTDDMPGGLRSIAHSQQIDNILPFLFLFDDIRINNGSAYSNYVDLSPLFKSGLFSGYTRQDNLSYEGFYKLVKPTAVQKIRDVALTRSDIRHLSHNPAFDLLINTIYDVEASFAIGDSYSGRDPYSILPEDEMEVVEIITDMMEALIKPQAYLLSVGAPVVSSMFENVKTLQQAVHNFDTKKKGLFGIYLEKVEGITGVVPRVNSLDDFVRLRDDKKFEKVRSLLTNYLFSGSTSNEIANELEKEIISAKRRIDRWLFRETPIYVFTVKPLSYIPIVGTIVSVVNDALDLVEAWDKRSSDWIYLGMK